MGTFVVQATDSAGNVTPQPLTFDVSILGFLNALF
jgi:hypothetical protein